MVPNLQQVNHVIVEAGAAICTLRGAAAALADLGFDEPASVVTDHAERIEAAVTAMVGDVVGQDSVVQA